MKQLHLFTGEKGGIGKSLAAQTVIEKLRQAQIKYKLFDADRTSPDVGEIYEPTIYQNGSSQEYQAHNGSQRNRVYFSEEAEDLYLADELIASACEQIVIVNLPAQVSVMVDAWLNRSTLKIAKNEKVEIYFWFVTDGSPESITLLEECLSNYLDKVKIILVVNEGLSKKAMANINNSSVASLVETQVYATIKMPLLFLSNQDKKLLKEKKIPLSVAAERNKREGLSIIAKQRIKDFLRECHQQIETLNIFGLPKQQPKQQPKEQQTPQASPTKAAS